MNFSLNDNYPSSHSLINNKKTSLSTLSTISTFWSLLANLTEDLRASKRPIHVYTTALRILISIVQYIENPLFKILYKVQSRLKTNLYFSIHIGNFFV